MEVLKGQGLTDLEFLVITYPGLSWKDHADGYEVATFPVMIDTTGSVHGIYDVSAYTVILIDKKGRMVTTKEDFTESMVDTLNRKIRDLHAE